MEIRSSWTFFFANYSWFSCYPTDSSFPCQDRSSRANPCPSSCCQSWCFSWISSSNTPASSGRYTYPNESSNTSNAACEVNCTTSRCHKGCCSCSRSYTSDCSDPCSSKLLWHKDYSLPAVERSSWNRGIGHQQVGGTPLVKPH